MIDVECSIQGSLVLYALSHFLEVWVMLLCFAYAFLLVYRQFPLRLVRSLYTVQYPHMVLGIGERWPILIYVVFSFLLFGETIIQLISNPPSRSCKSLCPTPAAMIMTSPFLTSVSTLPGLSSPPKHSLARPDERHDQCCESASCRTVYRHLGSTMPTDLRCVMCLR